MIQEAIKSARAHLENKEFNEGLAILQELTGTGVPEIEDLYQQIIRAKNREIEDLLQKAEEARNGRTWEAARDLIQQAQALDGTDERVRAAAMLLTRTADTGKISEELAEKKFRAKALYDRKEKNLADLDRAITLLDEVLSKAPGDFEAEDLLSKVKSTRSAFLRSQGQVATLEQAEAFVDALKLINDMIDRGEQPEFQGRSIFEYKAELEKKAEAFAEEKAGKYLDLATKELQSDPKLALRYINLALTLPFIPKKRREDLDDLKPKAELLNEKQEKVENLVREAAQLNVQGEIEKAIRILEGALVELPNFTPAQGHLKNAQQGLKRKILQDARVTLARLRTKTLTVQPEIDKAKSELLAASDRLAALDDDGKALRSECDKLLEDLARREEFEHRVKDAVSRAQNALRQGDLVTADAEISALDKEAHDHAEIRRIRRELAGRQEIEAALGKAREAFQNGHWKSAQEQIGELRNRARQNEEVTALYQEIEATVNFNQGVNAFEEENFPEARQAFQRVIGMDGLYKEPAGQYLARIDEVSHQDREAQEAYNIALKHKQHQRWEEAYLALADAANLRSSIKKEIANLRTVARKHWREQVVRHVREDLRNGAFEQAFHRAKPLEEIQIAEDTKLISEVKKKFNIHKAEIAVSHSNWPEAHKHWLEAQRFDAFDERIAKGLLAARKWQAVREADAASHAGEVIGILEPLYNSERVDPDVEQRLLRAYIKSEDYGKGLLLAGSRMNKASAFSATARAVRDLCLDLQAAREKFEGGAYQESVKILQAGLQKHSEYQDVIADLLQRRKKETIEKLLQEARNLQNKGESIVRIWPKYLEILAVEPDHREAKERNAGLQEEFKRYVNDLAHEAIRMENDENAEPDDIEEKIRDIQEAFSIATPAQQTKLNSHLERLSEKRRELRALKKKLDHLEEFLNEAKRTGDFAEVDKELSAAVTHTSPKNRKFSQLIREINDVKERRKKAAGLVDKIIEAHKAQDFPAIETTAGDLQRLDPNDDFSLQREQLYLTDPFRNEEISFKELKTWAQECRQNLERVTAWFEEEKVDPQAFEKEEAHLREEAQREYSWETLVKGLEKLAKAYRSAVQSLTSAPETPLSERADQSIRSAENLRTRLREKARHLEEEAKSLAEQQNLVEELVDKAGKLIDRKKFAEALPLVEEGLQLSSTHPMLRHFLGLIRDKLE